MARKSRKAASHVPTKGAILSSQCKAAIYVRLSVEDNGADAKDSIQNQIEYLKEYINRNGDDLQLIKVYEDNGTTGTNFLREGWQNLIEDVKMGMINCILVKDFSRMGRNYIEVGNYLEKIFPFMGIRIISVNDHFDSKKQSFDSNMLMNSLMNIVNDYYAKDISRKVVQARRTMQENGEYTSGVYPYGYRKSNTNQRKLAVDPEAADVVKKIFEWRVQGKSNTWIVNSLNLLAIPSPGLYRLMNGQQAYKQSSNSKWNITHVSGILKNPVYLGHLVQGKSKRSYFKNDGRKQRLPKEEWIVTENAHEPLITQEQFNTVANMAKISYGRYCGQRDANQNISHMDNPLRRKVYCGQCGRMMFRRSRVKEGIRNYYYFCDSKRVKIDAKCNLTMISEEKLMYSVGAVTMRYLELIGVVLEELDRQEQESEDGEESRHRERKARDKVEGRRKELALQLVRLKERKKELYEDLKEGMLTRVEFEYERERLMGDQKEFEEELMKIECDMAEYDKDEQRAIDFTDKCREAAPGLDRKEIPIQLLDMLIQKIVVLSGGRVEAVYAYDDVLAKWCEGMQIPVLLEKVVDNGGCDGQVSGKIS